MSTIKTQYGTTNQALTCTLASLANGSARQSTVVDNTSNLYLDALVQLQIKVNAAGVSAAGYVNVYAVGTVDDGTTYAENAGASDAAITLTVPPNARLIGVLNCVAVGVTYKGEPWSVAVAFGGVLPAKWAIIVENKTGAALDSTEGSHNKRYQGILEQAV